MEIRDKHNQSLENDLTFASCMHRLSSVNSFFFPGASDGNESDCASNPYMYAASFANQFGPTDLGTVKCLFTLAFSSDSGKTKENEILYLGVPVAVGCIIGIFGAILVVWVCWRRHKKCRERKEIDPMERFGFGDGNDQWK